LRDFGLSAAYPQSEKREYAQSDSGLLRTNSQAAWASDETIFQTPRSRPEMVTRYPFPNQTPVQCEVV
jgi:hypothetical protein